MKVQNGRKASLIPGGSYVERVLVLMLLNLSVFIISGCNKHEITSHYNVVDSGIWTYPGVTEKTFWLDNERVLLTSNKRLAPSAEPKLMTIWNVKNRQIAFSHQVTSLACVQNGKVFFSHQGKYYRGPLETFLEHFQSDPTMRLDEDFDCDWVPKINRAGVPYRIKLKDNNYLEILKESIITTQMKHSYGESRYFESLDSPPVLLPVHA